jgi:hypothetical protein
MFRRAAAVSWIALVMVPGSIATGFKFFHPLIQTKKEDNRAVSESLHSNKRHGYPPSQASLSIWEKCRQVLLR